MYDVKKVVLKNPSFYCQHLGLSEQEKKEIDAFRVRHPECAYGLERYLKENAIIDEQMGVMRTYLVKDTATDELAGYFSLKAGMVSVNEREIVDSDGNKNISFDTIPGIEIANFAVNGTYLDAHPSISGLGILIFLDFILTISSGISNDIGAKLLYIFALPYASLMEQYERKYHFRRLSAAAEEKLHRRLKPLYDNYCIFMYQQLS